MGSPTKTAVFASMIRAADSCVVITTSDAEQMDAAVADSTNLATVYAQVARLDTVKQQVDEFVDQVARQAAREKQARFLLAHLFQALGQLLELSRRVLERLPFQPVRQGQFGRN